MNSNRFIAMAITILLSFLLTCCVSDNYKIEKKQAHKCSTTKEKENLIQTLLDISDIQQFFYKKEIENEGLFIKRTQFVNDSLILFKYGQKVNILSTSKLVELGVSHYLEVYFAELSDSIHYSKSEEFFEFTNDCKRLPKRVHLNLIYPSQGMECYATLLKQDCDWEVIYVNVFEK